MEKLLLVVADYANATGTNKLNIMGIFNELNPPAYPYKHPSLYVIFKLRAELGEFGANRTVTIKFMDTDGQELLSIPQEIKVPNITKGKRPEINGVLAVNNLTFPEPGTYNFVLLVDRDHKGEVSIIANQPPQQG
jgi:hypothetical protein